MRLLPIFEKHFRKLARDVQGDDLRGKGAHGPQNPAMTERYAHLAAEAQKMALKEIEKMAVKSQPRKRWYP